MGAGRLTFYSFLVAVAGFLQHSGWFTVTGIRANFVMVLLIVLSFISESFLEYLWLVVLGLFTLKFTAGFDGALVGVALIALAAFWLGREMPWQWLMNNTILIIVGALAVYLLGQPSFLLDRWLVVAGEIIYNLIIGTLLFFALSSDERRSKF